MKVRDLLDSKGKDIVSIDVDSSVDDAIRSMNARKISAIMVTEQGKTVGIFTERDVVRSYIQSGGKSFREIAEATGESIDTLTARKRYALRNLSRALRHWIDE